MTISELELRDALKSVRKILDDLEQRIEIAESPEIDPYVRRRQILLRIYWSENNIRRDELMELLKDYGTNYAWIGQQVKKGYLTVIPARGGYRYSVTEKAIRDEDLDSKEDDEAEDFARASWESFAQDWDSEEDSVYDNL